MTPRITFRLLAFLALVWPVQSIAATSVELKITHATGAYEYAQKIVLTELAAPPLGVNAFIVELDGTPHRFELTSEQHSRCGALLFAEEQGTVEDGTKSTFLLRDYRNSNCARAPAAQWMLDLHLEAKGRTSTLQAEGEQFSQERAATGRAP